MAYEDHQHAAALSGKALAARCAVITLSDTRTGATDTSGQTIREMLLHDGHQVGFTRIIPDDPATLDALMRELLSRNDIDAILTNGGTGISKRDATIETLQKHFTQQLPGFGELFRMLSWEQIGSGAMLSRAIAGIAKGKLIFAMPGSTKAVQLAMDKLILPELRHLMIELRK